jgi:hypothetical protein
MNNTQNERPSSGSLDSESQTNLTENTNQSNPVLPAAPLFASGVSWDFHIDSAIQSVFDDGVFTSTVKNGESYLDEPDSDYIACLKIKKGTRTAEWYQKTYVNT